MDRLLRAVLDNKVGCHGEVSGRRRGMIGSATGEGLRLQLKKTIKTTREAAFEAWTKPEILRKWFGPGQMLPVEAEVDLRVGGKLRFVIEGISPRSGQHM